MDMIPSSDDPKPKRFNSKPDVPDGLTANAARKRRLRANGIALSGAWRDTRRIKLLRDPICQACASCIATEVHHIIERTTDPSLMHTQSNLLSVCQQCHILIHKGHIPNGPKQ